MKLDDLPAEVLFGAALVVWAIYAAVRCVELWRERGTR